jgi:PAS domain S-box-containing protein
VNILSITEKPLKILLNKCHFQSTIIGRGLLQAFSVFLVLLFAPSVGFTNETKSSNPLDILLLNSWHRDMPWQLAFEKGIRKGLTETNLKHNFFIEYLDAGRFKDTQEQIVIHSYLQQKYASKKIDVVVAESRPASSLLLKYSEIFPGAKHIYVQPGFSEDAQQELIKKGQYIIPVDIDFHSAVLELKRLSKLEKLYVIGDASTPSRAKRLEDFKSILHHKDIDFEVEFLIDLPMDVLLSKVSNLPTNSAIFYLLIFSDGEGKSFIPFNALQLLAEQANVPIFSHWSTLMGSGMLGGYLLSGERVGQIAARTISNIDGSEAGPVENIKAFGTYYDWRQMKRWGISRDQLLPDATIEYYEPSVYEEYSWQILIMSAVLILFVTLSLGLLVVNRKRNLAVKALSVEHSMLEKRVVERTEKLTFEVEERKQAQKSLDQFKTTLDMTMDCVFMFDPITLKFFYINQGAINQVGYSVDELLDMTPLDIKPEFNEARFRALAEEVIENPGHVKNFVTVHQHKDGHLIPVEIFLQYIEIEAEPSRFIAIVRDITERNKAEEVLREKEAAEAANQAKSMFLANMSHELRTPMHAILSFSNLGLKKTNDPKLARYFQNIRSSSIRLTGLLNDLLDLSKLDIGKMEVEFIEQDLLILIHQAEVELTSLLKDKSISINLNTSESVNCMVDHKLMLQVIINLLSNAIKFSPEFSVIDIDVQKLDYPFVKGQKGIVRLSVIDQGVGIPEDEIESIFDKFVQSTKTMTDAGGTGLGLAITKEIIKLHHGKIYAESPPAGRDKGTAVMFEVPIGQNVETNLQFTTIQDAIEKHLTWKQFIDDMYEKKDIPEDLSRQLISNENLCAFGMWINANQSDDNSFKELKAVHENFHSLARGCLEDIRMNNYKHAKEAKREFDEVSNSIIKMLHDINNGT